MKELTRVTFTNLEKVLYPAVGVRKKQVIEYYARVAPRMLDFLARRLAVANRFPDGVDKDGFYEKQAPPGTPAWVETYTRYSESSGRNIDYIVCNNLDSLLWLANLAALEIHISLSRTDSLENPDLILFDIDPEPPAGFEEAVHTAHLLKETIDALGLRSYVKTTGKKGLHVVLPVVPRYTFRQTREFVHHLTRHLAKESEVIVSELSHPKEPGRVFIDYPQNSSSKTMICPYSLRAEEEATVSTPLEWKDLMGKLDPQAFNIYKVVESEDNPWMDLWKDQQRLEVA